MKYLLFLLGGFEIFDGVITHYLVGNGLAREANPLMESIVMEGSFLPLKVIGVLLCVFILWHLYKRFRRVTLITTSTMVVFYGAVIAWNLGVFLNSINPV